MSHLTEPTRTDCFCYPTRSKIKRVVLCDLGFIATKSRRNRGFLTKKLNNESTASIQFEIIFWSTPHSGAEPRFYKALSCDGERDRNRIVVAQTNIVPHFENLIGRRFDIVKQYKVVLFLRRRKRNASPSWIS